LNTPRATEIRMRISRNLSMPCCAAPAISLAMPSGPVSPPSILRVMRSQMFLSSMPESTTGQTTASLTASSTGPGARVWPNRTPIR